MHDRLLEALLKIADVRLVASLQADELHFPSARDLRVFIPDLHLCSKARTAAFRYGLNREDLLLKLLRALAGLRAAAAPDETVEVYQLGDYLDLWRENLGPAGPDTPDRIKLDHLPLVNLLEGRALKAHLLLGNHDFDLWQSHAYDRSDRRYYIAGQGGGPALIAMHGDYFDWVERLPAVLKEIGVYLFAPDRPPDRYILGKMQKLAHDSNARCDYSSHLRLREPAVIGAMQAGDLVVPPEWNVQKEAAPGPEQTADPHSLDFLATASGECLKANAAYGVNMRAVVIGHTHRARIAVKSLADGSRFILIDCGAWIEECRQFPNDDPALNAQIAVVSANWARVYQLA